MRHRTIIGGIIAVCLSLGLTQDVRAIGPITSLTIAPTQATVAAGSTATFTVTGSDAAGAKTDLTPNVAFTTTDPSGSTDGAVYTAGKAGEWVVTGQYASLSIDATVTVIPGPVVDLVVNPNSAPEHVVIGAARTFTAEGFDALDNPVSNLTVQWLVEGNIGTVKSITGASGKFTATTVGKGRVAARVSDVLGAVDVTVDPARPVNANGNANTSITPIANTNVNRAIEPTNSDRNASTNQNENVNAPAAEDSTTTCTAWSRSTWVWIYLAYLALLGLVLIPIRRSRPVWWWLAPLLLTIASLWLYFEFRCYPLYPAWPYLVLVTGIVAAGWYNWQSTPSERR